MKRDVLHKVCKRPESWEKERTNQGSECAKKIRKEIERLSPFRLNPIGVAVESGYDPNLNVVSNHLDYEALYNGQKIAELDPTCCNYTFEGSRIMPVRFYKGEITKKLDCPTFFVYSMEKETLSLKDRCVWIRGKDVIKCDHLEEDLGGKMQDNYFTNKEDWRRGLKTLIDELWKLAEGKGKATG